MVGQQNYIVPLQKVIQHIFVTQKKFVIFETLKVDSANYKTYIFYAPCKEIVLNEREYIKDFFYELEQWNKKGFYLAGFFSYELGYFLDYKHQTSEYKNCHNISFPLAFFYVFNSPLIYNHKINKFENLSEHMEILRFDNEKIYTEFKISHFRINTSKTEYISAVKKIKDYICNGDTYQVNFTIKTKFNFSGSLFGLYDKLKQVQKVAYAAVVKTENFSILSFSPELFFRKIDNQILMKPMKGTIARGRDLVEDKIQSKKLYLSIKNRAENVMIVDLLRNDLGKLAPYGTVKVEKLFEIEKYETLFQMTSTISAKVKPDISLYKLVKAIFPSGSVTGAPKIRTMQIINETEKEPRKVYTGSIGFFTPGKNGVFNVAIRTILIDKNNKGEMGVGSGIVYDSQPEKEFDECLLKSLFLVKKQHKFRLIETILYYPNFDIVITNFFELKLNITKQNFQHGFFLLKYHLERLKNSALYFNFPYDEGIILNQLLSIKSRLEKNNENIPYRVRLLLSKNGKVAIECSKLNGFNFCSHKDVKIVLSKQKVSSDNCFLYHKTTNRKIFNSEYKKYKNLNFFDVLFLNEYNEVTECSRCNLIIQKNKKFYTPDVKSGLLPGVFRKFLMENNNIIQTSLKLEDIISAEKVFITNSVIGIRPAVLYFLKS